MSSTTRTTEPSESSQTNPSPLRQLIAQLKQDGEHLQRRIDHINELSAKLQTSTTELTEAKTKLHSASVQLNHDSDLGKKTIIHIQEAVYHSRETGMQPKQAVDQLGQLTHEIREATRKLNQDRERAERMEDEVEIDTIELGQAHAEFYEAAERLRRELDGFLERVEFVDEREVEEGNRVAGEVVRVRIEEYEGDKNISAGLEFIIMLGEFDAISDFDNVIMLKGDEGASSLDKGSAAVEEGKRSRWWKRLGKTKRVGK